LAKSPDHLSTHQNFSIIGIIGNQYILLGYGGAQAYY
jgi:hypothetical protein